MRPGVLQLVRLLCMAMPWKLQNLMSVLLQDDIQAPGHAEYGTQ